jgi:hypothetical protein
MTKKKKKKKKLEVLGTSHRCDSAIPKSDDGLAGPEPILRGGS